jgi:hypothetical protein
VTRIKKALALTAVLTAFFLFFVFSAFGRVGEIWDSLRVPGRIERLFFEIFQIGLGTGFFICLYLALIAILYLYSQGYLDRLQRN